jgi:hypothetical protein
MGYHPAHAADRSHVTRMEEEPTRPSTYDVRNRRCRRRRGRRVAVRLRAEQERRARGSQHSPGRRPCPTREGPDQRRGASGGRAFHPDGGRAEEPARGVDARGAQPQGRPDAGAVDHGEQPCRPVPDLRTRRRPFQGGRILRESRRSCSSSHSRSREPAPMPAGWSTTGFPAPPSSCRSSRNRTISKPIWAPEPPTFRDMARRILRAVVCRV